MGLSHNISSIFKNSYENKCLQLIRDAYDSSISQNRIKCDFDENDITSILNNCIENNPQRSNWQIVSNVEHHLKKDEILEEKGFAAKLPRIDLRFTTFRSNEEFIYHLEAKNLKEKDSYLKRRYIKTGIDNFVLKKYENGSLIGYILEGDLDKTVIGINTLLLKDKRNSEILNSKSFKLHNNYYESEHKEIGVLKHLMFDYSTLD